MLVVSSRVRFQELKALVGQATTDAQFRAQFRDALIQDPNAALAPMRYRPLDPDQARDISNIASKIRDAVPAKVAELKTAFEQSVDANAQIGKVLDQYWPPELVREVDQALGIFISFGPDTLLLEKLWTVVKRVMTDAQFRDALIQDPNAAVAPMGVRSLDPEQVRVISNIAIYIKNATPAQLAELQTAVERAMTADAQFQDALEQCCGTRLSI